MKYPSNDLVAVLWLGTLGLDADDIGTSLPANPALWAARGYVQATTVGGSPAVHVPMRAPAVQLDAWCCRPDSEQAPWNRAASLAGAIVDATYSQTRPVDLDMPSDYKGVRVHSVYPLSEPRPVTGDEAGFARVQFDALFHWSWSE